MDTIPKLTTLADIWESSLSSPPQVSLSITREKLHKQIDKLILSDESIDDDMYKLAIFKKLWNRKLYWPGPNEKVVKGHRQMDLFGSAEDVAQDNTVVFNNGSFYIGGHGQRGLGLSVWSSDHSQGQTTRAYNSLAKFCKTTKPGLLGARLTGSAHVLNIDGNQSWTDPKKVYNIALSSDTNLLNDFIHSKDSDYPVLNSGMYIIRLARETKANIEERHQSMNNIFCNQWIYVVDYGAELTLERKNLKSFGILDSIHIIQYPGSKLNIKTYDRGDQWRNMSITAFQNTETKIDGSTLLKDDDSANFVDIHHMGNDSNSDIVYKSAIHNQQTGNFIGRIQVDKEAINVESNMENKNLLIDKNSRAMSKPILNINTKDIKCSHGCTISKVREEDIYYLETLGASRGQAKHMIASGHIQI